MPEEIGKTQTRRDLDVTHALERMGIPAYVIDREGRIRWLNRGAIGFFGDRVGQNYTRLIAPEHHHLAQTYLAKKLIGEADSTDYTLTALTGEGSRLAVLISSAPLWEGEEITGVFGIVCVSGAAGRLRLKTATAPAAPGLTARQHQALALLAEGLGTGEIARSLGVAEETARNHIRGLLRQLDAHTRLEAVVRAYRLGLIQSSGD